MLKVSVANTIRHGGGESKAGAQQRQARERVAEQERQCDGQPNGAPVREPDRRPDDHPEDLADGAPGEAVQRRAERNSVKGTARCRQPVVVAMAPGGSFHIHSFIYFSGGITPRSGQILRATYDSTPPCRRRADRFRRDGLLDAAEARRCIAAEAVALEITRHIPGWPNKRRLDPAPLLAALQVMPM
jgi:hypothetical protein